MIITFSSSNFELHNGIDKKMLSKYQYTKYLQPGNGTGVDKKVIADVSEGLEKHRRKNRLSTRGQFDEQLEGWMLLTLEYK
ncbi:unnamed protein product [Lactuca virosa]|uniref:Uncharacterized protein n=1 Tax=Lactuca virosa TaxID=75947 RepID=A0AAU9LGB2_9ASTR|nr:unnamed protein product [Lactuca virosa]